MLGLGLDAQLGGSKPAPAEATDQLLGKADCHEGKGICPVGGRVELPANRQVRRRVPKGE